jgi:hypothetical protein
MSMTHIKDRGGITVFVISRWHETEYLKGKIEFEFDHTSDRTQTNLTII